MAMVFSFTEIEKNDVYILNGHVAPWFLLFALYAVFRGFKNINNVKE